MNMRAIPEVENVVGKLGRAETPLDPAPVSVIETLITYKPQYFLDKHGYRLTFKFNPGKLDYFRLEDGTPPLLRTACPTR